MKISKMTFACFDEFYLLNELMDLGSAFLSFCGSSPTKTPQKGHLTN